VSGPGGVGKGTIVDRLVTADPRLWLSRSWTTRRRRPGEATDAYHFVDRAAFEAAIAEGRLLEWAEVVPGQLSGTPMPSPPADLDLVLEINVDGARQVKQLYPDAVIVLIVAPSVESQIGRMRKRGDSEEEIARRVRLGHDEEQIGRSLADHVVVNDDLDRAVSEVTGILHDHRLAPKELDGQPPRHDDGTTD
jgi:guanylate kinase